MSEVWPTVRLGDALKQVDTSVASSSLGDVNLAGVYSFARGLFRRGPMSPSKTSYKTYNRLISDDFVISQPKAWEGALARVTSEFEGWFLSPVFPTFRANRERLEPAFLEWYCKREPVWTELQRRSRGIGARRETVSPDQFLSLEIPLPPLGEQRRVVARIEELAEQIQEARALLREVAGESEALLAASRRVVMAESGRIVSLDHVCTSIIDNLHSNPRLSENGIPCIRSPDVGYGTLNIEKAQRTDDDEYRHRTIRGEPRAGDIVFVREGGGTGKCAVVLPGQKFSLGQRVLMLRPNEERILPRFFLHQLLSPLVQEDQISPLCKGSASPHLNISSLRQFRLRAPTLAEQRKIASELDELQAQLNAAARLQLETAAEIDTLLPAILDRAFRGKL